MKASLNGVTSQRSNRPLQPMRLQYCCNVTSHHSNRDVTISQIMWIFANYAAYSTRGAVSFQIQHSASPRAVSGTRPHPSYRMPRNLQKSKTYWSHEWKRLSKIVVMYGIIPFSNTVYVEIYVVDLFLCIS